MPKRKNFDKYEEYNYWMGAYDGASGKNIDEHESDAYIEGYELGKSKNEIEDLDYYWERSRNALKRILGE